MAHSLEQFDILIVDDEPFMRKTLTQMLKLLGISKIREATNGRHALNMLVGSPIVERPNLVLCDVGMDLMDGIELLEKMRGQSDLDIAGLPVIVVSAHSDMETVRKAADRYIAGYLVKPFTAEQLQARLEKVMPDVPGR